MFAAALARHAANGRTSVAGTPQSYVASGQAGCGGWQNTMGLSKSDAEDLDPKHG